jgi:hypothetical protein
MAFCPDGRAIDPRPFGHDGGCFTRVKQIDDILAWVALVVIAGSAVAGSAQNKGCASSTGIRRRAIRYFRSWLDKSLYHNQIQQTGRDNPSLGQNRRSGYS